MKVEIKVPKILSYQTLVYKNGKRTHTLDVYKEYKRLIGFQTAKLPMISDKRELYIKVTFKSHDKRIGDIDNIVKPILDTLQKYGKIYDDRYVTKLDLEKKFGYKESSIEIEILERGE